MARAPRLALAGELHLLLQRGHNRQSVFVDDRDREAYLAMLRDAARQYGVAIHAYVLLETQVQLLATPREPGSLSRLMQSLGRRYVAAFNRRHGRSGTLWEGRFRTGLIDAAVLGLGAVVHVETLPVREGQAGAAGDWPWSSATHHLGRHRDPLLTELPAYWSLGNTPFERELAHAHRLNEGVSTALAEGFERAAFQGRAIGSPAFMAQIAERAGVPMAARPRGRPARIVTPGP
jgi:putative transposase